MILNITLFSILICSILAFASFVVVFSNPIFSVLALVAVFVTSASLLLQHGVDFLAFSLIIVYVGAIAVLFLFVVMMLDIKIQRRQIDIVQTLPIFLGLILTFIAQLFFAYKQSFGENFFIVASPENFFFWEQQIDSFLSNLEALGQVLYSQYMLAFLLAGILLLIAMMGAIVLTLQVQTESIYQDLSTQLSTDRLKYLRK